METDLKTPWNPNALPIVSDNMILFRLWVPLASAHTNLPALTLSRYAHCAQASSPGFFEELRKKMEGYRNLDGEAIRWVDLDDARRKKMEDIIVEKTKGDSDNITEPLLANSINEFVKLETLHLQKELEISKKAIEKDKSTITHQQKQIIALAAQPFYNKLGMLDFL